MGAEVKEMNEPKPCSRQRGLSTDAVLAVLVAIVALMAINIAIIWTLILRQRPAEPAPPAAVATPEDLFKSLVTGPPLDYLFEDAKRQAARAQLAAFTTQLEIYKLDVGEYPPTEHGLPALRSNTGNAPGWNGPYARKEIPLDPWDRHYVYERLSAGKHMLLSLGPDGERDTADDVGDLQ
jgi:general secretion pathway protein G